VDVVKFRALFEAHHHNTPHPWPVG